MTPADLTLIEQSRDALALKNAGMWHEAATRFEQLLAVHPDWEHGYGWFNLAECYEESGRISEASLAYQRAVSASPTDSVLVGGRASFLYLHGELIEAVDEYIKLLSLDQTEGNQIAAETTMTALSALATRLDWSKEQLAAHIENRQSQVTKPPSGPR